MLTACRLLVLALVVGGATSTGLAQTASGEIQGTVTDASGEALAGVTVTITHIPTGRLRETITDRDGFFAAPALQPGQHEAQASRQGYATRRQPDLLVQAGRVTTIRLELTVAPAPETITVAGTPPVVDFSRSEVAVAIEPSDVRHLPLRTRDALTLALFAPAASVSPGGAIQIAGQPGAFNTIVADGAELTWFMGLPSWFSAEAAHSVLVSSGPYTAERGRTTGGVILMGSHSGANSLAGSLFTFQGGAAPGGRSSHFGGSVGGPLVRDRHFAFAVYEGRRAAADNPVGLHLPEGTPGDSATQAGIARLTGFADVWERTDDRDFLLAKTDHRVSDAHRLTLRYQHGRVDRVGGSTVQPHMSRPPAVEQSERSFLGSAVSVIGSTLVNEARVHVARFHAFGAVAAGGPTGVVRHHGADVLRIGDPLAAREAAATRFNIADTLTWQRGPHQIRSGVDLQFDRIRSQVPGPFAGAYAFNSLASFGRGVAGSADTYAQAFEGASTSGREARPHVSEYSLFVQDAWHATREITAHAGLRYDAQTFGGPAVLSADRNNLAPRAGVAWSPLDDRMVVRAGYGIVYGRTPWPMVAAAQAYNGTNVQVVTLHGGTRGPVFPDSLDAPPAGSLEPAAIAFAADYETPRVQQATAGFEWEWMPHTAFAAHYLSTRGDRLPRPVERARGPADGRVITYESTARSRYHGVVLELTRRLAQGHSYRVSYSLGRARDTTTGGVPLAPETPDDRWIAPATEIAAMRPAGADHRHRLAASVVYESNRSADRFDGFMRSLVSDWTVSAVYTAQSGAPFSAYVNGDFNGDGNRYNDLAPGAARNEHRLPARVSVDPRISRAFQLKGDRRITVLWEAFNLFNRVNYTTLDDVQFDLAGSQLRENPLFGEGTAYMEPRTMHVAVRVSF